MELVNSMGVRGIVTDAGNGRALDAVITVVCLYFITGAVCVANCCQSEINHQVKTDPANGDYYRLLTAGTYHLKAAATGYQSAETVIGILI